MSEPILRMDKVAKSFGGLRAVDGASFDINPGEIVGLIGPNGAGKTTVFNLISGYFAPSEGSIFFKGQKINGQQPYQMAKKGIGRTFQVVKPFPGLTVLENVVIAALCKHHRRADAEKHAWELLEFTGLADRAEQSAASLTLPGRKRLEISKALALDPELLLLDEVVAGLNPTEADQTIQLILKIRDQGISILIVEHIMRVIMNISDNLVVLNFGSMIATGKPAEIVKNEQVIQAYLGKEES
ncbi:ABC transporter ATP-binding protein [uncultured Desulfobacter sp.]|uniref:ABC transporter ATP-binding protein n=1 Tax=uncultured Desulfobacter sp. TaxID=240139 RepID=UPI0029C968FA|nr:ABC transporter ATP-binding protein [uncultured Desulfobacter sp.]